MPSLLDIFRWIYYAAFLALLGFLAWRYREQLREFWKRLLAELTALWGGWRKKPQSTETEAVVQVERHRTFAEFTNPFAGTARRWPIDQLLRYSFAALEAWARDRGVARSPEETPIEFARRLGAHFPDLRGPAVDVGLLYSQWAYGGGRLPREAAERLRRFWNAAESARPATTVGGSIN